MILKIDSTDSKKITVELVSKNLKNKAQIIEKQKFGSQVLLPMINKILNKNKLKLKDLTGIEVNCGPGSFTGTRVGVAVANTLGFVLDISVNGKKSRIVQAIYAKSKFDL